MSAVSLARMPPLVGYVFRACMPAKRLAALALPVGAILVAGLMSTLIESRTANRAFAEVSGNAIFGLALPLGALIIGDAVLGAEARSGNLAFTWLSPARFGEIAVARWLGGWMIALVTLVPAVMIAAVLADAPTQAVPIAVAATFGTGAHIALFVAIGALTRRAAVWSLAIVFLIEGLFGEVLSGIAQLSPTWQARAVFVGFGDTPQIMVRSGIPHGGDAIVRLVILTVVFLRLAAIGLRRMRLTGSHD